MGPEVTTAAVPEVPDFAFEAGGVQQTLRQMLETGPLLLMLFAPPAPLARLQQLAAAQPQFGAAGLRAVAVGLAASPEETSDSGRAPPYVVSVSSEVISTLALFRAAEDGGETELILDLAGNVRARWTSTIPTGFGAACCTDRRCRARRADRRSRPEPRRSPPLTGSHGLDRATPARLAFLTRRRWKDESCAH